jgi:hypothetical protein
MLRIAGLSGFLSSRGDNENIERYYTHTTPLTEKEQARIFNTMCRVSAVWAIISSYLLLGIGICTLAPVTHVFSLMIIPPIALVIGAFVLMHFYFDILHTGDRAERIARDGGLEDPAINDDTGPFAASYLIRQSFYPKICAFLIRQAKA